MRGTPHNETLAAFAGLSAVGPCSVWLLETIVPGAPERWRRLDADGEELLVELPAGFEALRFVDGLVLGVHRDDLGVERFQLYELAEGDLARSSR